MEFGRRTLRRKRGQGKEQESGGKRRKKGTQMGQMHADSWERTDRVPFEVLDLISRLDLIVF